jgi:sugar phosphate isomerase/epimerase
LVSVSFRQLSPPAILALAKENDLGLIEWGGDIHVPEGDLVTGRKVGEATRSTGLKVAAYGSYYRLGGTDPDAFQPVLNTAVALGAPAIRVWAGNTGSEAADEAIWKSVCADANRIAGLAEKEGLRVALEFHGGTLNDTPGSARRLWQELDHPNLRSLWQPLPTLTPREQNESLSVILPHLSHVHVFHWNPGPPVDRRPLAEGAGDWARWFGMIKPGYPEIPSLLEFVVADDPDNLSADAATLHKLLESVPGVPARCIGS